ncbi:MAG TPA: SDR family oxidoreductase [Marmoricola sp.]|nr:SDR family oxidoreductase [Marmoricola sp.]
MSTRIAVAGGTGVVGRHVVDRVRELGHDPVVLARSKGVDVLSGTGLAAALDGVDAVVDVTNVTTVSRSTAVSFFETATTTLVAAEKAEGVRHHVVLSIVGVDRVDLGYYIGKRRQEQLALAGPVPTSVLRATQFHEFPGQLIDRGGPVTIVPTMLSQPIAAREVADALVDLALAEPSGLVADLAGPEQHRMVDLVRRVRDARGSRRPVVPLRLPGRVGAGLAGGALLPQEDGPRGRQTFDEWLSGPGRPGSD